MAKNIVTISREFGSGGRTIGKLVAEALGYNYYDKELVRQVAVETGFAEDFVEEQGEESKGSWDVSFPFGIQGVQRAMGGLSAKDFLWVIQRKVILDLAEKGRCVIVGRSADYILRQRTDCLNVFIHAPIAMRAERIVRLYGESEKSPEKRLMEKDKKRSANYKRFTEQDWGKPQNYHLCLDSGLISIERCAELITDLAKSL